MVQYGRLLTHLVLLPFLNPHTANLMNYLGMSAQSTAQFDFNANTPAMRRTASGVRRQLIPNKELTVFSTEERPGTPPQRKSARSAEEIYFVRRGKGFSLRTFFRRSAEVLYGTRNERVAGQLLPGSAGAAAKRGLPLLHSLTMWAPKKLAANRRPAFGQNP